MWKFDKFYLLRLLTIWPRIFANKNKTNNNNNKNYKILLNQLSGLSISSLKIADKIQFMKRFAWQIFKEISISLFCNICCICIYIS